MKIDESDENIFLRDHIHKRKWIFKVSSHMQFPKRKHIFSHFSHSFINDRNAPQVSIINQFFSPKQK